MRQIVFDPARGFDEVHGVVVVLLNACADGEDVRIENDVLRREADFIHQNAIRAFANANFVRARRRLALLIERHHDDRRAIFKNLACVIAKLRFAFLHRNGIHDAFALKTFQAGLDDFPLGRVHHERNFGDFRFAAEQQQEARHRSDAINHPFVHADVYDVRAVLHLLARDAHGLPVFVFLDELRKLRRTRDVRALADHDERSDLLCERLRATQAKRQWS